MYLIFDIGGTSTKVGIIDNEKIIEKYSEPRKENLEDFIKFLDDEILRCKEKYNLKGVGFSSPGTVDSLTGNIGGISALEYIHTFNFAKHLQDKHNLPVSIENDANCAALAQLYFDNPKEKLIAFFIIGSGIGGAVIKDGNLVKGRRLETGEFGYMLLKNEDGQYTNMSQLSTMPNVVRRLKEKYNIDEKPHIVLEKYFEKEEPYYSEVNSMFEHLCMGIYNVQYTLDPEVIYIGGGISQSEAFMEELKNRLKEGIFAEADVNIKVATFHNDNNIYGAYANLLNTIKEGKKLCTQ